MKKYLIIASAALFALAACEKQAEIVNPDNKANEVVLTFTSERPQLVSETKTAWDAENSCIVWSSNDKIRVGYTLDNAWMGQSAAGEAKFYTSDPVIIDNSDSSIGTFKVPISASSFTDPNKSGSYKFFAVYPQAILYNATVSDPTAQSVTIKETQSPSINTFDSTADVLLGQSEAMSISALPTDPIELSWTRVVSHVVLTFSNLGFEGTETVTKATLTFNDDAKVTGSAIANISEGTIGSGSSNVLILDNGFSVNGNNVSVWGCVLPTTFTSLDVELKTDKATYSRSITGISKTFKKNAKNSLTIKMESANRTASEQYDWVKKDLSDISSSDIFVIVGNNGANYAMNHTSLNTKGAPTATAVTVSNNKLSTVPSEALQWTLSSDSNGYMFYPAGDNTKWLNLIADNNGLRVNNTADNGKYWNLDSGYLKGTDTKNATRYIGIYQSTDWRSYTSNGGNIANQTIAFYVRSTATPSKPVPTISFGTPTTEVNIGETVTNVATIAPSTLTVTYSSSDDAVATVSTAGVVTGVAAGTATITASFAGDETYDEASAEYEITVIDPNANDGSEAKPYTASEAIAVAENLGSATKDVYVKGIVCTTGSVNTQYNSVTYYISDDGSNTSRLQIYSGKYIDGANFTEENNLKMGDYVVVYGTLKLYNSSTPEIDKNSEIQSVLRAPTFSPNGGSFNTESTSVEIFAESGATIRYTIDGTNPTSTSGSVYNGAISITATTTVKAIAIKDNIVTGVSSATFTKTSSSDVIYSLYSGELTEGDYVIVYSGKAMKNTVSSNRLGYADVTVSGTDISNPDAAIVWHIAKSGNYWTIYNASATKYAAGNGTKNQGALVDSGTDDGSLWTASGTSTYEFVNKKNAAANVNANLRNNGTYGFACYGTGTGGALSLYKKN